MGLATNPHYACEVTLQPVDRYPLDAAILFSDILTIPDAMGLGLSFVAGEGPKFAKPVQDEAAVKALYVPDPSDKLKYVTDADFDTVLNAKKEYRPKLFKRLRTFTWVDPVHETVRLTPVIFDSDVEILHKPQNFHSKRDFSIFIKNFQSGHELSPKIRTMYAKELLKTGDTKDFQDAKPIFQYILEHDLSDDAMKEASCVLTHVYRLEDNKNEFFKLTMKDMLTTPCSEICYELGTYFLAQKDLNEAVIWFYNAAYETESILDVHTSGDLPLYGLVECYELLLAEAKSNIPSDTMLVSSYEEALEKYRRESQSWTMPAEN